MITAATSALPTSQVPLKASGACVAPPPAQPPPPAPSPAPAAPFPLVMMILLVLLAIVSTAREERAGGR